MFEQKFAFSVMVFLFTCGIFTSILLFPFIFGFVLKSFSSSIIWSSNLNTLWGVFQFLFLKTNWSSDFGHAETGSGAKNEWFCALK